MTTFLSQILGKPVWDSTGQRVGSCADILVKDIASGFPLVRAMALKNGNAEPRLIPAESISWLAPSIILNSVDPPPYEPVGDEVWLARQVLDRQIVDTDGRRLVRVNDLQLVRTNADGPYCLGGVDVGGLGLLRRLGVANPTARLYKLLGKRVPHSIVPWSEVAPLQAQEPLRLKVSRDRISELRPADIAQIVTELDRPMGDALLNTLSTETIADAMEEIEPELQASIIGTMAPERAADVLEEMGPDEAADLLGDLHPSQRSRLLNLMQDEDAVDIQKLLSYPDDTAGGIMTTEYATIPDGLTVGEALDHLRQSDLAQEDEALYYVYVLDKDEQLLGVVGLRDLVLSPANRPVREIMEEDPITVNPLQPQNEVGRIVARYNLLAVPVVDEHRVMHGIVTVDDAIDAIIPTAWKKRLPHFF